MSHVVNPTPNPVNPAGTVCANCGAPLARTNARASATGWKHYPTSEGYRAHILALLSKPLELETWYVGNEPRPEDRRRIEIDHADSDLLVAAWERDDEIEILDHVTGERITVRRADCGAGCRCALELVPAPTYGAPIPDDERKRRVEDAELRRYGLLPGPIPEELRGPLLAPELEPIGPATPCDECGHPGSEHRSLHDEPSPVWSSATCWAELLCGPCLHLLHHDGHHNTRGVTGCPDCEAEADELR